MKGQGEAFIWKPEDAKGKNGTSIFDFIVETEHRSEVKGLADFMAKKLLRRLTKDWGERINGIVILVSSDLKIGSAVCSQYDTFDERTGIKIAQTRLLRRPITPNGT